MKRIVALSAIGFDRPGIVAGLSQVLFELGCNLEESSMTRLRRDFAVILLISIPETVPMELFRKKLQPVIDNFNLTFSLRELNKEELPSDSPEHKPNYIISVYGVDQPGIVYRVSELLAANAINITDLQTQVSEHGKKSLYALILEVTIAEQVSLDSLRTKLKDLGVKLSLDISIKPIYACENM